MVNLHAHVKRAKLLPTAHQPHGDVDASVVNVEAEEIKKPRVTRIAGAGGTRPKGRTRGGWKNCIVNGRANTTLLHQAMQLFNRGQAPVGMPGKGTAACLA